ncbi:MAG TPA: hypothetical protein VD969_15785 [Symbiobacteriaceae bacterium]|nr:hypothetical protein [Symbiobacteriaceae bacterium]
MSEPYDREEREFMKAVGLDAHDLEWLVQGAPAVPAAVAARVLRVARLKTAPLERRPWRLRQWGVATAAAVVLFGLTAALSHEQVQAVIREWMLPVPGFGISEGQPDIWCSLVP